jgi:putative heme-binding domain-containing protein
MPSRQLVASVMAQSSLREAPSVWVKSWLAVLADQEARPLWPDVLAAVRQLAPSKADLPVLQQALLALAHHPAANQETRLRALAALPGKPAMSDEALSLVLRYLPADQPVALRVLAVEALGRCRLKPEQLRQLAAVLPRCSPLEADRLLEAFAANTDDAVAAYLLDVLERADNRGALRPASIRRAVAQCSPSIQRRAENLIARLDATAAQQKEKLEKLLAALKPGDVRRGQAVFHSPKAACISCHTIGYLGGRIGPDLTRIGSLRSERDLLESIVFPSASFVQSYEPYLVATKDGRVFNGLIREDRPEDILLITGPDQQVRIRREDIEEIQPSKVSIMPSGFDQQLTLDELSDLIAFLKSCK